MLFSKVKVKEQSDTPSFAEPRRLSQHDLRRIVIVMTGSLSSRLSLQQLAGRYLPLSYPMISYAEHFRHCKL